VERLFESVGVEALDVWRQAKQAAGSPQKKNLLVGGGAISLPNNSTSENK
jgi:hypothetical protein